MNQRTTFRRFSTRATPISKHAPNKKSRAKADGVMRSVLTAIDTALMGGPEIYLNFRDDTLANEEIADEAFKTLLRGWVDKFADWIARLKRPALSI